MKMLNVLFTLLAFTLVVNPAARAQDAPVPELLH